MGVSPQGNVVGQYKDVDGVTHGFVFDGLGYTTFDVPGFAATVLTGINPGGTSWGAAAMRTGTTPGS